MNHRFHRLTQILVGLYGPLCDFRIRVELWMKTLRNLPFRVFRAF